VLVGIGINDYLTLQNVKVGGPLYERALEDQALLADLLPPPLFIAGSNLTIHNMLETDDASTLAMLTERLKSNRAEFDLTGPLTADKKLLYRLVAVRQDSDGFYDRTYTKRWVFAPMVTYRFSATSEVTLKYDTTETAFGSYNGLPLDRLTRQIIAVDPKTNYADSTNFRTDRLSRLALAGTTQITNWLGARLALTGVSVGVDREESRVGGRAATGVTGQAAEFFGTLPVTGDRTTLLRNSQYFKRESLGLTLQNDYVARFRTGPLEHTTLAGFEWHSSAWGDYHVLFPGASGSVRRAENVVELQEFARGGVGVEQARAKVVGQHF
jgi:hypothetical protein